MLERIAEALGARDVRRGPRIQSLWGGYGEAFRVEVLDGPVSSAVVKHVCPGPASGHSHARKLRSYAVEATFYEQYAARLGPGARIPSPLWIHRDESAWCFVLEDLDAAGFRGRTRQPDRDALRAMVHWLAHFHASFVDTRPRGLWKVGSYWHLATRPDELSAMPGGPLKRRAMAIDRRLARSRFRTLIHGDAKPANFCISGTGVAAVDFQYVGGGVGVVDLAYLLHGLSPAQQQPLVEDYFAVLRGLVGDAYPELETEWRALYPWAQLDFCRFLVGWSPGYRPNREEKALIRALL